MLLRDAHSLFRRTSDYTDMSTIEPSQLAHKLVVRPDHARSPLAAPSAAQPQHLPRPRAVKTHASAPVQGRINNGGIARLYFVGTATCILEWCGIRLLTDPNFVGPCSPHETSIGT